MLLATPKNRGFKSSNPDNQIVSVKEINDNFKVGETVSPKALLKKGLIDSTNIPVKILGQGELNKELKFEGVKMSNKICDTLKKS